MTTTTHHDHDAFYGEPAPTLPVAADPETWRAHGGAYRLSEVLAFLLVLALLLGWLIARSW